MRPPRAAVYIVDEFEFLKHVTADFLDKDVVQRLFGVDVVNVSRKMESIYDVYDIEFGGQKLSVLYVCVDSGRFLRAIRLAKRVGLATIFRFFLVFELTDFDKQSRSIRFGVVYAFLDKDSIDKSVREIMDLIKTTTLETVLDLKNVLDFRFTTFSEIYNYFVLMRISPLAESIKNLEQAVDYLEQAFKNMSEVIEIYENLRKKGDKDLKVPEFEFT